jgi:hypothetical protein
MQWIKWTILAAASCLPALALAEEPANKPENPNPGVVRVPAADRDQQDPRTRLFEVRNLEVALRDAAFAPRREKGSYLGVSASPPPPVLRKQLGLHEGMGLVVDLVVPESPAAKAGLQQFDVLQKLDDQLIVNPEQLAVLVRSHKPGEEVKLGIIHEGKSATLTAKLAEHDLEPLGLGGDWDVLVERAMPEARVTQIAPGQRPGANAWGGFNLEHVAGSVTWLEGDRSYTLTTNHEGRKTFTVKGTDGKQIFEGPINSREDREKVPADLRTKLDKLMQSMPGQTVNISNSPVANPATQPVKKSEKPGSDK